MRLQHNKATLKQLRVTQTKQQQQQEQQQQQQPKGHQSGTLPHLRLGVKF